jgi:hypothetical protein
MNINRIQNIVVRIVEKQSISVGDVTDLQSAVEEGGFITRAEADALFRAERMAPVACASWSVFFIETLTAHVVWERRPTGRITEADVAWLCETIALPRSGPAANVGPLLLSLLREAVDADEQLVAMALAESADADGMSSITDDRREVRPAA